MDKPARVQAKAIGRHVVLREPTKDDAREFLKLARASSSLHRPWVTPPTSPKQFRAYLARMAQPENAAFLVCRRETQAIVAR